ncbi:hypothetical protein BS47DRAFT_1363556 [Hydnum rufescens UP504]|uniref:Uncharacterized protein n=1 Tax=Hydnum rufescens UP504 TaxID=1448309 RepID=A0A9P6ATR3_9AGAM|nr:hypothetical protein BS47DRAFT_1363556 [Hydnum rufescens UP504]
MQSIKTRSSQGAHNSTLGGRWGPRLWQLWSMPRLKGYKQALNLGEYAQKKIFSPIVIFDEDVSNPQQSVASSSVSLPSTTGIDDELPTSNPSALKTFMACAWLRLPQKVRAGMRGAMEGVKGSYSGCKINGQRAPRSIYRDRKCVLEEQKAAEENHRNPSSLYNWLQHLPPKTQTRNLNVTIDLTTESGTDNDDTITFVPAPSVMSLSVPESTAALPSEIGKTCLDTWVALSPDGNRTSHNEEVHSLYESPSHNTSTASLIDDEHILNSPLTTKTHQQQFVPSPTIKEAQAAAKGLEKILRPPRPTGAGHMDPNLDLLTQGRLELMRMFLNIYANDSVAWGNGWIVASLVAATATGKGQWTLKTFLTNAYGRWNVSMLVSDEDLAQDITLHLQGLGPFISALDIVRYLDTPEIKTRLGLERSISLKTASRWMQLMQYRWGKEPKGQYVDGHERDDVVTYRQSTFLPAWAAVDAKTRKFDDGSNLDPLTPVSSRPTIIWNHDDETAKPYAKGKGTSLMVADFVSPDYGWLREPGDADADGARVFLRPGKEHDGYFMCNEVLAQVTKAMDVLDKHYRMEDHVFIYDNVTTHKKHADNALSARHMPKYPPNPNGKGRKKGKNWGVKVPLLGPNGNVIHGSDGKVVKVFKKMADAQFSDGRPQPLYFLDDHPQYPGLFKGMAVILEEHGFSNARSLKAECKGFKLMWFGWHTLKLIESFGGKDSDTWAAEATRLIAEHDGVKAAAVETDCAAGGIFAQIMSAQKEKWTHDMQWLATMDVLRCIIG